MSAPNHDVRQLIEELEAELSGVYSDEQRHGLSVDRIFQAHVLFFIARLDGKAVGCGGVAFADDLAEVKRMYVRPEARGRGVAQAILDHLEKKARLRGATRLVLETGNAQYAAIHFYERAGFTRCEAFGEYAFMPPRAIVRSVFFEKGISSMQPIHLPSTGGKKLNVLGIPMVIRIHGRETGGIVSAVESHDVPNCGPPPHIHHREDETFQILEGEYEWTVGGKTFVAQKGATIFAPRGIPHTYRYLGQTPGRLMCVITPAGFEGFFEEIGALSPQLQQDISRVLEIARKYAMEVLPPAGT